MTITQDCSPLARAFTGDHEKNKNICIKELIICEFISNLHCLTLEIPNLIYLEPLGVTKSCQVFQAFLLIQDVSRILLRYFCWRQHVPACDLPSKCGAITRQGRVNQWHVDTDMALQLEAENRCLSRGPDESVIIDLFLNVSGRTRWCEWFAFVGYKNNMLELPAAVAHAKRRKIHCIKGKLNSHFDISFPS